VVQGPLDDEPVADEDALHLDDGDMPSLAALAATLSEYVAAR